MFYSPFTDDNGNMKYLNEIDFDDLRQLKEKDVSEGISIEYKIEYTSPVQKKIPNIISSFANEKGGWIFVGIDDDQKDIKPIEKKDYELTLNNQLRDMVNPKPRIQVRFISEHFDDSKGVLVIFVHEGDNPPYISSGKIYRRIGSGTNQVKEIEDRYHLDKLYDKAVNRKNELKKFCNKDISIYNGEWNLYSEVFEKNGMLSIYIIPTLEIQLFDNLNIEEFVKLFMEGTRKSKSYSSEVISINSNLPFMQYTISHNSVIFRNTDTLDFYEQTIALEIFYNGSAKIHIPLLYLKGEKEINEIASVIKNYKDSSVLNSYQLVDGKALITSVYTTLTEYFSFIKKVNNNQDEFIIVKDLEYVRKDSLYFDNDSYWGILERRGMIYSEKNDYTTNEEMSKFVISDNNIDNILIHMISIFNMFGFTVFEGKSLFYSSINNKTHLKT